jgi:hypothetical protein
LKATAGAHRVTHFVVAKWRATRTAAVVRSPDRRLAGPIACVVWDSTFSDGTCTTQQAQLTVNDPSSTSFSILPHDLIRRREGYRCDKLHCARHFVCRKMLATMRDNVCARYLNTRFEDHVGFRQFSLTSSSTDVEWK